MLSRPAISLLKQLASEGVSPWLDAANAEDLFPGALSHGEAAGLVHGIVARTLAPAALRRACDALWDTFVTSDGLHGRVSVPVDPRAAGDAKALVAAARHVHAVVGRANLQARIPATPAGLLALAECLALGISVEAGLVFSAERYEAVLQAYLTGMERALAAGLDLRGITATASVPVGVLDSEVNTRLAALPGPALPAARARDTAALAVAREVYGVREQRLATGWWQVLRAAGATPPGLLWTTGSPRHISALIGWNTAHAFSLEALEAAALQEELRGDTLLGGHEEGRRALDALARLGIRMPDVAQELETVGLTRLRRAWTLRS
ncbi:transaldolase family protein [Streptomyces sp. NPDC085524]|uniref:transaldolase family protein n=1 Tax=unclassified Streptomyces TaxID=2593676 RepID=UPI0035DE9968